MLKIRKTTLAGWLPAAKTATTEINLNKRLIPSAATRVAVAVAANIHETPSSDDESFITVDWLARDTGDIVNVIRVSYGAAELDSKLLIWVRSMMPEEDYVTLDALQALEGQRADLVVSNDSVCGLNILNVLPAGRLSLA